MVVVGDINPPAISPANLDFFRTDVTSWDDLSGLFKKASLLGGQGPGRSPGTHYWSVWKIEGETRPAAESRGGGTGMIGTPKTSE